MKKNDLIKLLQDIPGNPDIMSWNGYVQDIVPLKQELISTRLTKMTKSHYFRCLENEELLDNRDFKPTPKIMAEWEKLYTRVCKYEFDLYVSDQDIREKKFTRKNIFLVVPQTTGKEYFDRIGEVRY